MCTKIACRNVHYYSNKNRLKMTSTSPTAGLGQLHNLCRQGNVSAISEQLQDIVDVSQLEEQVGFLGYTPLHEATNQGHVAVVRLLLLYGANPNAKANGSYTPLHMAASMDNVSCVMELIKHNADITNHDEFGKTPCETAVINRCKGAARLLKSAEIKKAASENHPDLKDILKSVRDKDVTPQCYQEALLAAIRMGHVEAISVILLVGSKENLRLKDSIREAVKFHFYNAAAMLLVCYAAKHAKEELLKYLMGVELRENEREIALRDLPYESVLQLNMEQIKGFLRDRDSFQVAVPIRFACQHKKRASVRILLSCTNCKMERREVEWRKLALYEIDRSWLEQVKWVEKLYLSSNLLTSIPSNIVDLQRLCRLDLRKNQLKTVLAELLQMPLLKELNLSENRISELPRKCLWSPSLRTLNLSDNLLEKLPKTMASAKLVNLYLARNNLYEVPSCISELITLSSLDLSSNPRLISLPIQMGRLTKLTSLKLENLEQMTDPPDYIKKKAEKTIMYLRARLRSSRGFYSMKLLLVGRANQGKTTLMHRLMWDYNYNINRPTNGISMNEFPLRKDIRHHSYLFKVWDFGGQEDYHVTHQLFLSTLALYILVWNMTEGLDGVQQLEGWLDTISARSLGTSLVIVGTHLDKIRNDQETYGEGYVTDMHEQVKQLAALPKYGQINVVDVKEVSCATDCREGINDLRFAIYDAAACLLKNKRSQVKVMGELIPHSYLLLVDLIQQKRDELLAAGELPILHRAEYEALVMDTIRKDTEDIEEPDDMKEVTVFLHERGFLIHYDDPNQDLQDLYFIDPKWLCELMARVVTLREVNPFIINGILHKKDFAVTFKGEKFADENYPQFIRLLNRFQIACSLDEERVLVPSKLPATKPEEATADQLPFITLKRIHSLPYMPYGFWNRFTARLLSYTKDMLSLDVFKDEWSQHVKYKSPFQLDPFCCRCPLTVADPVPAMPSPQQSEPPYHTQDPDVEQTGDDVEDGAYGFSGCGGLWFNGKFIQASLESEDNSPRTESNFEYSSGDEADDANATKRGKNADARAKRATKGDLNADSPRGDSDVPYHSDPSTVRAKLSTAIPEACDLDTQSQSGKLNGDNDSRFVTDGVISRTPGSGRSFTSVSSVASSASDGYGTAQHSSWNDLAPARPLIRHNASAAVLIPRGSSSSSRVKADDNPSFRDELEPSPLQSDPSSCAGFVEPSGSLEPALIGSSGSFSTRSSLFADDYTSTKQMNDDVFVADTCKSSVQLPNSEPSQENPGTHASPEPQGEGLSRDHVGLSECAENGTSGLGPTSLPPNFTIRSISQQDQVHLSGCPCADDFPIDGLPDIPVDLCTLVDGGFLHCWLSGVCLHHPRLFFMVTKEPDPSHEGRQCIVTQVSPSPLGRRILSYIVDHVDTLIREWYPNLSQTDGRELIVRQQIPCVVCERLGLEAHRFSFVECQHRSSVSDRIDCPNHSGLDLNLHHVAPDIMLHDVGVDLLVTHDQLEYEDSEVNLLGSGGFGRVIRGECRGQPVAIKFYNSGDETDPIRHYLEARKELNVLRRVRQHPYLINIIGVSLRPLCLVLELADKGSLLESLRTPMAIHRIVLFRIAYQVADALAFLHGLGVIYRDLKPENVLVWSLDEKKDLHVKLIDFGTANFATSVGLFSCKGSKGNHAPEMLQNKDEYTAQVDVYSYAILLYRLITRRSPFEDIDSEPQVNAAVLRGERPAWKDVNVAVYGLTTLTELMLRCWLSRPTLRPTTAQIAEQLRQPAFQALLGKQAVPTHQSVRCSCLTGSGQRELWLACDDPIGNKVLIFDTRKLEVKFSFSIDTYQEQKCSFQIQCLHAVTEHILIGLRGDFDVINIYSTTAQYRYIRSIPFSVQITGLASNEEHIFVGLNEGRVHCMWKKDLKKADKRRPAHDIREGWHQIQSLVAVKDKLWVASSKYIFSFFTKAGDMDAFDMEALWYGGPERLNSNPQTRVQNLTVSFDEESVWSSCRAVLLKWDATNRHKRFEIDCVPIINALGSEGNAEVDSDVEACITCLMLTFETVWVSTTSGHILIFNSDEPQLLTWLHVLQDVRTLNMCIGPGPCETEQCYVISTGKGLLPHGLGTSSGAVVCPLTPERVNEVSDEVSPRKSSDRSQKRTFSWSSAKKLKVNTETSPVNCTDGAGASLVRSNCVMLVWEAPSASVFARMEAKSGRRAVRVGTTDRPPEGTTAS